MKCGSSHPPPMRIATRSLFAANPTSHLVKKLLFHIDGSPSWTFFVEICEDLWVPIPPSSFAALAGATVILNLSASNVTISKDAYRHSLVSNQSARCLAAYLYTAAGEGESTTDLAWDGHALIYENGHPLSRVRTLQKPRPNSSPPIWTSSAWFKSVYA